MNPDGTFGHHGFSVTADEHSFLLNGYEQYDKRHCFCLRAFGLNYAGFGIVDGSMLLCSPDIEAKSGDLVVVNTDHGHELYVFSPAGVNQESHTVRVTCDKAKVEAVVLGSFNFYH